MRLAVFALALFAAAPAFAAANGGSMDDRNPFFNASLFAMCDSADAARRAQCTAYLGGFAEGYIWNSPSRCYGPSPEKFRAEYLATLKRDRALIGDPSGAVLFALMERLSSDKCEGVKGNTK